MARVVRLALVKHQLVGDRGPDGGLSDVAVGEGAGGELAEEGFQIVTITGIKRLPNGKPVVGIAGGGPEVPPQAGGMPHLFGEGEGADVNKIFPKGCLARRWGRRRDGRFQSLAPTACAGRPVARLIPRGCTSEEMFPSGSFDTGTDARHHSRKARNFRNGVHFSSHLGHCTQWCYTCSNGLHGQ